MPEGRLITFEGVEGCGKTTQLERLAARLRQAGVSVVTTREPGGTALGEGVRDLLLDPAHRPTPLVELFLLEAARAQLVAEVVAPALAAGQWVLADRFADSSLAYQGSARGLGEAVVGRLNELACAGVVPDRTLIISVPVATALARARSRASTTARNRRFEDEALRFHHRVANAYGELAERDAARVRVVDGDGSVDEVHARVVAALADLWP